MFNQAQKPGQSFWHSFGTARQWLLISPKSAPSFLPGFFGLVKHYGLLRNRFWAKFDENYDMQEMGPSRRIGGGGDLELANGERFRDRANLRRLRWGTAEKRRGSCLEESGDQKRSGKKRFFSGGKKSSNLKRKSRSTWEDFSL